MFFKAIQDMGHLQNSTTYTHPVGAGAAHDTIVIVKHTRRYFLLSHNRSSRSTQD